MTHEFEVREEISLDAAPEQVWAAIATGPGVDSWLMGRNEIEPREGGRAALTLMGHTQESTVTAWEPGKRFAMRGDTAPDGTFMAFEYLIEGRDGGGTVLRMVHSGLLGDDWEEQYDALSVGDRMYLEKLAVYLRHFPGRVAAYSLFVPGPPAAGQDRVWTAFKETLGLTGDVTTGDRVRLSVDRPQPVDGVVEFVHRPSFLGVRTDDSVYMFIHGFKDAVVVERHCFTDDAAEANAEEAQAAWQSWVGALAQ
jgi:uncharacterized protein YndB with AHSA1/START domain